MSIYDTLNKEQQEAVFCTEGPLLILAGAGSGKTRVITHRIAYLMQECDVNPWNILAITFTNKAAGEMRDRVDRLIGFGSESIWISTFHSMCVRILRRHADLVGYDTRFTIYDADDARSLVRQCMKQLDIDTKMLSDRTVAAAISRAKNLLQTPDMYLEAAKNSMEENFQTDKIADIYRLYDELLRRNNAMDFDDLLMRTAQLFTAYDEVLQTYQERFRYICVDEYQDTNKAQFELVRMLAGKYRNLCVVGDDDQSIYKFRGADIHNILDFEKVYPDAKVIRLEQNYRSTQNILSAANAVIANNRNRKAKKLWTDKGDGSLIHLRELETGDEEAAFVASDIRRKRQENPSLHYADFAVLYRSNAQSRALEDQFVAQSIPYNIVGGHNFYDRMEEPLAKVLAQNLERMGVSNAIVVSALPAQLARRWPEHFDAILVDAPCSGEGMFRRDPAAREEWNPASPEGCARRQAEILDQAARMLRPGGRLVYSTCTFNRLENEETIAAFLERRPDFSPEDFELDGIGRSHGGMLRVFPHRLRGDGHFAARLRRAEGDRAADDIAEKPRPKKGAVRGKAAPTDAIPGLIRALEASACRAGELLEGATPVLQGDRLYAVPTGAPPTEGLRVLSPGLCLLRAGRSHVEPEHALAMALDPSAARRIADLDDARAAAWLAGEALPLEDAEQGWTLATWRGMPLGWGKLSDGVLKNHLPKGLRRTITNF